MALDLVSAPFAETGPPAKRRRLGWDVPDPTLVTEAARLQLLIATQLLQGCPSLFLPQSDRIYGASRSQEGNPGVECEERVHDHLACAASPPWHEDDKDGHFNFDIGENLTSRYKIMRKMGEGTFGRVLECWDKDAHEVVAIKVVRSSDSHREAAMIEIDVLRTLSEKDIMGSRGKARRYFRHERTLDWPERHTSRESIRAVHRLGRLRGLVMKHVDKSVDSFVDLLERMFSYDPAERPTAKEALRHPFFDVSSAS